ncbi:unnamed protein product, partial [Ectocarpus sp. 12 AP-2014]
LHPGGRAAVSEARGKVAQQQRFLRRSGAVVSGSGQQLPRATAARTPVASEGHRRHECGRDAGLRRRQPAVARGHAQGRRARCPPQPSQEVRGGYDAPQHRHERGNGR